jgi:predicted transcriptional regulator
MAKIGKKIRETTFAWRIRIPHSLYRRLKSLAERERRRTTDCARMAIEDFVAAEEKKQNG